MRSGIELARWFGYELERNAQVLVEDELAGHLEWIMRKYPQEVRVRTLQMGRRQIANAEAAKAVLSELASQGLGTFDGKSFRPHL
jgi:hypothetical protein